jgi:hypothetical protein
VVDRRKFWVVAVDSGVGLWLWVGVAVSCGWESEEKRKKKILLFYNILIEYIIK